MIDTNNSNIKEPKDILASLGADVERPVDRDRVSSISDPSNHYSPGVTSSIEERAVSLLGSGIGAESVASALGVTPGRISQMLAETAFSDRVSALRYKNLQSANARDSKYNTLEDSLLEKLNKSLPLLVRPRDILDAMTRVNNAKRRGQSAPDTTNNTQNVVNIILPTAIASRFVTNMNNQVTKAGNQELLTMPSGNLLKQVEAAQDQEAERLDKLGGINI